VACIHFWRESGIFLEIVKMEKISLLLLVACHVILAMSTAVLFIKLTNRIDLSWLVPALRLPFMFYLGFFVSLFAVISVFLFLKK